MLASPAPPFPRQVGAKVVSISLGYYAWYGSSRLDLEAIEALGRNGTMVVAAAFNDGSNNDVYPVYPASHRPSTNNVISGRWALTFQVHARSGTHAGALGWSLH